MGNSVYFNVLAEVDQSNVLRSRLIKKISEYYDRFVLVYYTNFHLRDGFIEDQAIDMVKDLLIAEKKVKDKLLIILSSPGGDPLSAERFIHLFRQVSDDDYWVLIPGMAKSAATMISLGASKIIMAPMAELGPIDMQVHHRGEVLPALTVVKAYDELMEIARTLPREQRLEPFLQQLGNYDAAIVSNLRQAHELSIDIARKTLANGMLRDKDEAYVNKIIDNMVDPSRSKAHGRPIFFKDIKTLDEEGALQVEEVPHLDGIHKMIHEYHVRLTMHMNLTSRAKLIETRLSSFSGSQKDEEQS